MFPFCGYPFPSDSKLIKIDFKADLIKTTGLNTLLSLSLTTEIIKVFKGVPITYSIENYNRKSIRKAPKLKVTETLLKLNHYVAHGQVVKYSYPDKTRINPCSMKMTHHYFKTSLRNCPVYEALSSATSSGVPMAMTIPPPSPPSGPRSII